MGFTTIKNGSFVAALDSMVFLSAGLTAYPESEVQAMAAPLHALIDEGDALAAGLRKAQRAMTLANARVRTWDGVCDDNVRELNKDALSAVRLDRSHAFYRALFDGRNASEVIPMRLEAEIAVLEVTVAELGKKSAPAELRKTWLHIFEECVTESRSALDARQKAEENLSRAFAAIADWTQRADDVRRSTDALLTLFALKHRLGAAFNDRFFPATSAARTTKKTAPDAPSPTPAPTP